MRAYTRFDFFRQADRKLALQVGLGFEQGERTSLFGKLNRPGLGSVTHGARHVGG